MSELQLNYKKFGAAFPNARVRASTLSEYWKLLEQPDVAARLPVVTSEIGDTWMYGCSSDPLMMAQMRALFRLGATPSFQEQYTAEYVRLMPMLTEHTHGGQGHRHFPGMDAPPAWSAAQLAAARSNSSDVFFGSMEATWAEQRREWLRSIW